MFLTWVVNHTYWIMGGILLLLALFADRIDEAMAKALQEDLDEDARNHEETEKKDDPQSD